jgi:hypothetical protein
LTLRENDVPLATPENGTDIEEEAVPLADMPTLDNLPQTGQLRWPVPALSSLGAALFIIGVALNRRRAYADPMR